MTRTQDRTPIIRLTDITFGYPAAGPILHELNFSFYRNERIGLVAPNGSGKTTLFHLIMGLVKPVSGSVELFGTRMESEKIFARVRHRIGLLFQDADDQLFSPTVLEDVAFGPLNLGKSKKAAIDKSKETLAVLGLSGFEDRITIKLSGGEKRLVALATILAMDPEMLLLDEPTSGLDDATKHRLKSILRDLNLPYLLISHEFDFLKSTTDHIYTMNDGKILMDQELIIHSHEHAHVAGRQPHKHV
ncbi:MAG: ABC transporter ATP-binding protein [Desulfobacteraceae bacterium]|nr:ABC transporter ATP-binding protein [Desulfobacteraceae bacterium]